MLMRTDPFRDLDRFTTQLLNNAATGTWSRPNPMPLDAYRDEDQFIVAFDLPGVAPDAIDLDIERNVLTVKAERRTTTTGQNVETQVSERLMGVFSRQLFLGDTLDTDHVNADYTDGVLTLRIPVKQTAKPRRIAITTPDTTTDRKEINV